MLYYLLQFFTSNSHLLNITKYITLRAMLSFLTALIVCLVFTPWFIRKLKIKQLGQMVRDDGPQTHLKKTGTPTMGGCLIIFAILCSAILWGSLNNPLLWASLCVFIAYFFLGFIDDYKKIIYKNSKGVSAKTKFTIQWLVALSVCGFCYYNGYVNSVINIPFFKNISFDLGGFYVVFSAFIIVATCNAVNLTDGLDGLAIGPVMTAAFCYAILSYVSGHAVIAEYLHFPYIMHSGELTIIAAAVVGAGLGFLWYNTYPAQVFMGDVGSLPLGGLLGALAVFSKHEILLALVGGIFVIETLSVITQVASYKLRKKRIFRMAPIHHHFELKGWAEPKIIVRFWISAIILSMIALLSLKIR